MSRLAALMTSVELGSEYSKGALVVSNEGYEIAELSKEKSVITENISLFTKTTGDSVRHRVFLGTINGRDSLVTGIVNCLLDSTPESLDTLEIRINSPGGSIDTGMAFINLINNQYLGKTKAFIDGAAASMASSIFCSCTTRIVYPSSSIMFHNYSAGAFGKGSEIESLVSHMSSIYPAFLVGGVVNQGFLTAEEYSKLQDGKDYYFNTIEMCARNIATHVMVSNHCIPSAIYLEIHNRGITKPESILEIHLEEDHS